MLDATGIGDPIADDLLRAGVPVEPIKLTNESKKQIIEKLSNWIELGNCKMLNLEETKREFTNFTYDMTSQGRILYQAPLGFHDDIVISHALAVWGLQPIAKKDRQPELSVVARDFYEKAKKAQAGDFEDIFEYENV